MALFDDLFAVYDINALWQSVCFMAEITSVKSVNAGWPAGRNYCHVGYACSSTGEIKAERMWFPVTVFAVGDFCIVDMKGIVAVETPLDGHGTGVEQSVVSSFAGWCEKSLVFPVVREVGD